MPVRIKRERTRGWRKPEGAVIVSRPSRWGNPFTVQGAFDSGYAATDREARALCAAAFESCMRRGELSPWWFADGADRFRWMADHVSELAGRDLCCWCPDDLCHASVLLDLANGEAP